MIPMCPLGRRWGDHNSPAHGDERSFPYYSIEGIPWRCARECIYDLSTSSNQRWFTYGDRSLFTLWVDAHWIGGSLSPRVVVKETPYLCREPNPGCPVRSLVTVWTESHWHGFESKNTRYSCLISNPIWPVRLMYGNAVDMLPLGGHSYRISPGL
jgi:hypothetical protein